MTHRMVRLCAGLMALLFCVPPTLADVPKTILDGPVLLNSGTLTGLPSPTSISDAATKGYVDTIASGLTPQMAVKYATTAVLPNTPTYSNGALGVGATLESSTNNALVIDGATPSLNDRVLVKDQAAPAQNGAYYLSQVSTGAQHWILTRATDWDTSAEMKANSYFFVTSGTANVASTFFMSAATPITVGSTNISFTQFSVTQTYTAGAGLTLAGSQFSLTNSTMTLAGHVVALGGSQTFAATDMTNGVSGSGAVCLTTSCVMTTPSLGAATAVSISMLDNSSVSRNVLVMQGTNQLALGADTGLAEVDIASASVRTTVRGPLTVEGTIGVGGTPGDPNVVRFYGTGSGYVDLKAAATAGTGSLTLPLGTGTLVSDSSTASFTNKTFDTAASGNVLRINGLTIGTMATQNSGAVNITGGTITGLPGPTGTSDAATKDYVDTISTGLAPQTAAKYATAAALPNTPTYANGTLGVGATLTAGSNTDLVVDGLTVGLNERVLVKNQAAPLQNGTYQKSQTGTGSVPWVLTRVTDWDTSAEMKANSYFFVTAGTANASTGWFMSSSSITVGTTNITFQQFSSAQTYTAGSGLTLAGSQFSLTNSSMTLAGHVVALGGSQTFAAADLTNGTSGSGAVCLVTGCALASTILTGTSTFNSPASVTNSFVPEALFSNSTNPVVVSGPVSPGQFDHIRISRSAGSNNTYTITGVGSLVSGLNFQMESLSGSDANSNLYGVIGAVTNDGPGTVAALYGRAITAPGSTGGAIAIKSGVGCATGAANCYGQQQSDDTYTNGGVVLAGWWMTTNVAGQTVAANHGLLLDINVAIQSGGAGLKQFAVGPGDFLTLKNAAGSSNLFEVLSTGSTGVAMGAGGLVSGTENLAVKGFGAFGTSGGVIGLYGDTGAGSLVFGSRSNHAITIRTNNTQRAIINADGRVSIGNSNDTYPLDVTGDVNTSSLFRVGGAQIAAANLSNGVSGSGAVCLVTSCTLVTPTLGAATATALAMTGPVTLAAYTVSGLPTPTAGMIAYVTDAVVCAVSGTLSGGGSTKCPVFYNGSSWRGMSGG